MTEYIDQTELVFSELKHTFTDPKIRIQKGNSATITIKIGGMIRLKLMLHDGVWHMIDGHALPYTDHLFEKFILTKTNRDLREQVVDYLKTRFDINTVHLHIA